jgi:hydrogenase-4 component F
MEIFIIISIALILSAASLCIHKYRLLVVINVAGHLAILVLALGLVARIVNSGEPVKVAGLFYADALSGLFIITIAGINFASMLYSAGYIAGDLKEGEISQKKAKTYYVLFNLFSLTMFLVTVVNNLGMVWVAIEMTTLVSAFLVGFYNKKTSIEAAWKYIIICSVGITLALFGTILFYYTASFHGGIRTMNWSDMLLVANKLDPKILKVAFLFVLVGYGTKAGLAPMHTWLPDAHSQAPAPISALLSGVLLKTALYAVLRFTVIINKCIGSQYCGNLLILFGVLSLGVSAGFILVQKDLKRLLAYSSVEHIGIISLGFGFGGPIGVYGALLHIINHAATKPLMFFGAGNIVKAYKTNNINIIRGVIKTMPFTGIVLSVGVFALAGAVPFSLFISEIIILISGFLKGAYAATVLCSVFIAVIFAALVYHFSKILYGRKQETVPVRGEPFLGKVSFIMLLTLIFGFGVRIPGFIHKLLLSCVAIINRV